jgi:hypothetical protein
MRGYKTVEERRLDKWVAAEAKYIQQRANVDFDREAAGRIRFLLDNIGKALRAAEKQSVRLFDALHSNSDKYIPTSFELECGRCRDNVLDAMVAQNNAADNLLRHIQTNAPASGKDLHKVALEAAHEYCGQSKPRDVRELARRILREAGIPETKWGSEEAITRWLRRIRSDRT